MNPKRLAVLGLPGSGKSVLASTIAAKLGLACISIGDALRQQARSDPQLALTLEHGEHVDDDRAWAGISDAIAASVGTGFVLDGFPRTVRQLAQLDLHAPLELVLLIDVDESTAVTRIRVRANAQGERNDATEHAIATRIEFFKRETLLVLKLLRERGILVPVSGEALPSSVASCCLATLRHPGIGIRSHD